MAIRLAGTDRGCGQGQDGDGICSESKGKIANDGVSLAAKAKLIKVGKPSGQKQKPIGVSMDGSAAINGKTTAPEKFKIPPKTAKKAPGQTSFLPQGFSSHKHMLLHYARLL